MCQFGLAHVDTPKGDLDASSGALTGPDTLVIQNDAIYPFGTTEQFPSMYDSDQNVMTNSAHYYRECSNKGICDRGSGLCACFDGYSGSACQYASCPVSNGAVCSGHGQCLDIKTLAALDSGNVYNLWDEHSTLGCKCDAGFSGADCSLKTCKTGADPLYYDEFANVRYSNWTVQFYTTSANEYVYGNYSLIFTDASGEDWQTAPIDINANCLAITTALESLPNNVIPMGTVRCFKTEANLHNTFAYNSAATDTYSGQTTTKEAIYDVNMFVVEKYVLAFPANPGKLAPLQVNKYLDGYRPTLYTKSMPSTLGWHIYPNGFTGEDTDYVADECQGVLASLSPGATTHYLSGLDTTATKRLMACLGDSNGVPGDNINTYNWDYGNWMNPHLIKLVEATQDTWTQYVRPDGSSYLLEDIANNNGGAGIDSITYDFPVTKLCTNGRVWVTKKNGSPSLSVSTSQVESTGSIGQAPTVPGITGLSWDPTVGYAATSGYYNIGQQGYCANVNPPGFYAVLYYDDCSAQPTMNTRGYSASSLPTFCDAGYPFRILTRAAQDYGSNTKFHIFTTQGWLQQVNQNSGMFTTTLSASTSNVVNSYFSNVVHFANVTENSKTPGVYSSTQSFVGQIDCETNPAGTNNALDCVEKGDMLMFLNLGQKDGGMDGATTSGITGLQTQYDYANNNLLLVPYTLKDSAKTGLVQGKCFQGTTAGGISYGYVNVGTSGATQWSCPASGTYLPTAASLASNPVYPNIYTVKKIGRNAKDFSLTGSRYPATDALKESFRHTAVLGMALNGAFTYWPNYRMQQAATANSGLPSTATVYKFHPPTGYNYVGQCSNRGVCNSGTGVCQCFTGYTGDNCGTVNSLAM